MPPRRLQALYSSNLFAEAAASSVSSSSSTSDPTTSSSSSSSTNPVLSYLIHTRGLQPRTLRKYGVGRAQYKFATEAGQWQTADCVTFSWMMSVAEAQFQESLRGAVFDWHEEDGEQAPKQGTADGTEPAKEEIMPHQSSEESDDDSASADEASSDIATAAQPSSAPTTTNVNNTTTFVTRRIKARSIEHKAWQRLDPPGGAWGFFGYHTIPPEATELVLTEGEYDAMAVWQATGRPAISLPNGCRSLPVESLPLLERFEKIYLWMDNDGPGQEGAELFAKKIGLERCFIVRPSQANTDLPQDQALPKDANEALLRGLDLERIVADARLTPHDRIMTFDELRSDVLHEILYPDKYVGVPLPSFPKVTSIIKGLRRGELTVLTGPTGSGKVSIHVDKWATSMWLRHCQPCVNSNIFPCSFCRLHF